MRVGLYLHFPFCVSRCSYCDFNAYAGLGEELKARYLAALEADIARAGRESRFRVETVFLGGGTPSLYDGEELARVIEACRRSFDYQPREVTVEGNPGTLSLEKLQDYRKSGIDRLSLGVQSFQPRLLSQLNRIHSAEEVDQAVQWARLAGFDNLSLDLIYGLPNQTMADWRTTVERALAHGPEHLSVYQLTVEPGTHLEAQVRQRQLTLPQEGRMISMDRWMRRRLRAAGFQRYEISNWCRPGYHSRHNRIYWQDRPYLGLGCGATGFYRGWRIRRLLHPASYCQAVEEGRWPVALAERMGQEAAAKDTLMMGLRTCWGINLTRLYRRYPQVIPENLRLGLEGLPPEWLEILQNRDTWVRLSGRGADFATSVQHHLMDTLLTVAL